MNNFIEEIKKIQIKELEKDHLIDYKEITNIKEDLKIWRQQKIQNIQVNGKSKLK